MKPWKTEQNNFYCTLNGAISDKTRGNQMEPCETKCKYVGPKGFH
jgi:hypothetical protein